MITITEVQSALDQRLAAASGLPDIVWPEDPEKYQPVIGTPFIVPTLLNNAGELLGLDGDLDSIGGFYNILLNYPRNEGVTAINAAFDTIKAHFTSDRYLGDDNQIRILNVSKTPNLAEQQWLTAAISIQFEAVG